MNTNKVLTLKFGNLPDTSFLIKNSLYINTNDFINFKNKHKITGEHFYASLKGNLIFVIEHDANIVEGTVAFGKVKKDQCMINSSESINLEYLPNFKSNPIGTVYVNLIIARKSTKVSISMAQEFKEEEIDKFIKSAYNNALLNFNQQLYIELEGAVLIANITSLSDFESEKIKHGYIVNDTKFEFSTNSKDLKILASKNKPKKLTKDGFNFNAMGVGGMHDEINKIFRTAFVSRQHSADTLKKFGIKHVKGVLLHGPPGTGKTLIARTLANMLEAEEFKVVNGPELFDKYVGETEKKIRELFIKAEEDEKANGENAGLHVIVFDEIDSICRARGTISSGTGVHDTAVNQLLTKIDGVESLNNILIIGMTNRKELIDEAILRPGRLEVHVEIKLPSFEERIEIFNIHTKNMRDNNLIESSVKIEELSRMSKNFTGAEIETLVKRAASSAMNCFGIISSHENSTKNNKSNKNKSNNLNSNSKNDSNEIAYRKVNMEDFNLAFEEVKPMFGSDNSSLESCIRFGMINYGSRYNEIQDQMFSYVNQLKNSKSANIMSILLHGEEGTGKTSIACHTALKSGFPYVKILSPNNLVKLMEGGKAQEIMSVFENAYKSPLSIVIIDNIERLIEYIKIGPRFSNLVLQALLVYIKKLPTIKENKIMIIGTTSMADRLDDLELVKVFNYRMKVPCLNHLEIKKILNNYEENENKDTQNIVDLFDNNNVITPLKKLLMSIDETQQESNGEINFETFNKIFKTKYMDFDIL